MSDHYGFEKAVASGFYEAGSDWLEPWCEEHPEGGDPTCLACVGASHDAWMHRAKAAESILAEVRSDLGAALRSARPFVYNVMCEHRGTWRGETAKAVLDAVDAVLDKGAE